MGVCHIGTRKHHTELLNWQLKFAVNVAHNKKGIEMLGLGGKTFIFKTQTYNRRNIPHNLP